MYVCMYVCANVCATTTPRVNRSIGQCACACVLYARAHVCVSVRARVCLLQHWTETCVYVLMYMCVVCVGVCVDVNVCVDVYVLVYVLMYMCVCERADVCVCIMCVSRHLGFVEVLDRDLCVCVLCACVRACVDVCVCCACVNICVCCCIRACVCHETSGWLQHFSGSSR